MRGPASVAAALCGLALATVAHAQTFRDQVLAARSLAERCDAAGAYTAAQRALADAERRGGAPAELLIAQQDLATFANRKREYAAAAAHAEAAMQAAARLKGTDSPEYATVAQNRAVALAGVGRRAEARTIFELVERLALKGGDDRLVLQSQIAFSDFEFNSGRPASGLAHAEQAAGVARRLSAAAPALAADGFLRAADANRRMLRFDAAQANADAAAEAFARAGVKSSGRLDLVRASIAYEQGRFDRALALAAGVRPAASTGACDATLGVDAAHRTGTIRMIRREIPEARAAFTSALAQLSALGLSRDPRYPEILYGLATTAALAHEYDDAGALFDRTAASFRQVYGGPSEAEAQVAIEKAMMLGNAGRGAEAVASAKAALKILDGKVEQGPLQQAYARAALGLAYRGAESYAEADAELRRALAGFEAGRGGQSFDVAPSLLALGTIAIQQGRQADAQAYLRRALAVQETWGGKSALATGVTRSHLAQSLAAAGRTTEARAESDRAVAVLRARVQFAEAAPWADAEAERRAARTILERDLRLRFQDQPNIRDRTAVDGAFQVAQLATATRTGAAVAQVAARLKQRSGRLADLLRARGDAANEWRYLQDELTRELSNGGAQTEERQRMLLARQAQVMDRVRSLDRRLESEQPGADALLSARPVGVGDVQAALNTNEAMVSFAVTDDATYVIVASSRELMAFRSRLTRKEVDAAVQRLRVGLDRDVWKNARLPPFDSATAYQLFAELVAPAQQTLAGVDTLLLILDGSLGSIPFSIFLTRPAGAQLATPEDFREAPWLVRTYALTTFPSASSLVALRALRRVDKASSAFFGVGAPVLAGGPHGARARGDVFSALSARRLADPAILQQLPPLPETRQELDRMAAVLGPTSSRILSGADATERRVRQEDLSPYRVVAFATHGLVAGSLTGYAEPALVLTPPNEPSDDDDGLLSASEVTMLRLNADWVILSACSTAAGDGTLNAEPLSGLAKAFFYAGARSLLVTHWSVDSDAAAIITTRTVSAAAAGASPAHALQRAFLSLVDDQDGKHRSHPYFWAAFALAGG
jgi:CHAT domain-containing protein